MSQQVRLARRQPLRTGPMGAMAEAIQQHTDQVKPRTITFADVSNSPVTLLSVAFADAHGKIHVIRMNQRIRMKP